LAALGAPAEPFRRLVPAGVADVSGSGGLGRLGGRHPDKLAGGYDIYSDSVFSSVLPGAREAGDVGIATGASTSIGCPSLAWTVGLSEYPGLSWLVRRTACSSGPVPPGLKTWVPSGGISNLAGCSAGADPSAGAEASGEGSPDGASVPTPTCWAETTPA